MGRVVGIDLGTTNSVVAYVNAHGKPEVIRNEFGRAVTPSVISFGNGIPVVGDTAKEQQRAAKKEIVQLFKRNMDDEYFLFSAHGRDYSPVDLSALVLAYMKAQAERFLKEPVTDAVITVPAYFTDPQRKATIKAGQQAGLQVRKIIHEPTAAALAYGSLMTRQAEQLILVYDLGGGTFDVSLIEMREADKETKLRVIATDGNSRLGGADWDDRLLRHVVRQFEQEFSLEMTEDECEVLYSAIEYTKHALSVRQHVDVSVQARGHAAIYRITRAQFESFTSDLMQETQMLTERLLRDAGVTWKEITDVLSVGGAARMPMARSYIERMSGKPPMNGFNSEEVVALGAALEAMKEMEQQTDVPSTIVTNDAIAHGLGMIVESADRSHYINSILIRKNSPIPFEQTRSYQKRIRRDGKTQLEIFLTQGDSTDPQHCVYLGRYLISGFPSLANGKALLDISYRYDKNGLVHISAIDRTSGRPLILSVESRPVGVPARFAGSPTDQVRQDRLTVYLAFDLSGSMQGDPLEKARCAALSFVESSNLATTSIGLLSFSDRVYVNLPATQDKQVIYQAIGQLALGRTGYGNNGDPFEELSILLSKMDELRYAVVLTDGARWSCPEIAIQRAQRCHTAGIEVFAVGFGAANSDFLSSIASSAEQGILLDLNQLIGAFSTIAQEIAETGGADTLVYREVKQIL